MEVEVNGNKVFEETVTPEVEISSTLPRQNVTLSGDGKVVKEDVFDCLSRQRETYRLLLTTTHLLLHNLKHHTRMERYAIDDIFGCHTLRHKKYGPTYSSAYICFYLYPRCRKKTLMSSVKCREKVTLVFEVKHGGNSYEENLDIAIAWKNATLDTLSLKFPKSQSHKQEMKANASCESSSQDIMEHLSHIGEALPLETYTLYVRRYLIILNPKSGQGKSMDIFQEKVAPIFREAGIMMQVLVTQRPGHARETVHAADFSDIDGIITIGGDGIIYEVVNGLRSREDSRKIAKIPIGVVAGGSGNGLARSLAEYSNEAEEYLKSPVLSTTLAAARGKIVKVNLAEVELDDKKIYSFLSTGWGLMADIDIESEILRALGEMRFTLYALYKIAQLKSNKAKLTYIPLTTQKDGLNGNDELQSTNSNDRKVVTEDFVGIYSSYQSFLGSDMMFAPSATINDGVIHLIYMLRDIGRTRVTQFLLNIDKGSHLEVEGAQYIPVQEFTIECEKEIPGNLTIDGEKVSASRIRVKLASSPLNVFSL